MSRLFHAFIISVFLSNVGSDAGPMSSSPDRRGTSGVIGRPTEGLARAGRGLLRCFPLGCRLFRRISAASSFLTTDMTLSEMSPSPIANVGDWRPPLSPITHRPGGGPWRISIFRTPGDNETAGSLGRTGLQESRALGPVSGNSYLSKIDWACSKRMLITSLDSVQKPMVWFVSFAYRIPGAKTIPKLLYPILFTFLFSPKTKQRYAMA
mmetsp:Transcript_28825/g.80596  ORF Transcript_28825/g.80596 Transcript_28825/m.80596 type:complete len:209 (+) Transcript_28825:947-1573(+)